MLGLQHVVTLDISLQHIAVAPPRGVRGLKFKEDFKNSGEFSRTPSWGAWIEMSDRCSRYRCTVSHPLVGCVD